jgi:DNA repair photolyase
MLKKRSGNLYEFVTHSWNPVKGECPYHCSYCYVERMMNRYGKKQSPLHLDEKELRTNLGRDNFIFVCSGCDLFHPDVPDEWILKVLQRTFEALDNTYLWHTKNPRRVFDFLVPAKSILCVTVESNIPWPGISKAPQPSDRINLLREWKGKKMITIEPVMKFSDDFAKKIIACNPFQVNIGADSGNNHLPEPSPEKIAALIEALRSHNIKVELKNNLRRLINDC